MEEIDFGSWRPSRGAPATLGEVYDAAVDAQRKYQNVNSYTRNLMEAYDRVNDEIKRSVGADIINPLNRYRATPGDAMGAPGQSVYDAAPQTVDPIKQWEADLDALATKHPTALDWAGLKARPVSEVAKVMKESEERNSDVMQRRGFIEPKDIPAIGRVPLVRDVVGGVANIVKDPAGMAASFAGSLRGTAESPADIIANLGGLSGSAAKSLVRNAVRNGLANAGIQSMLEPVVQGNRAMGGLEYGWDKAIEDIAGAFGTGAALDLAFRPAGRAAIRRFGTDAPEGVFSKNEPRGGWITDAPENLNLPKPQPKAPDIAPEVIERARNDDVAALREIAEKTGIMDQPGVKAAFDYAELGGKVDEAAIERFRQMGVDTGEGMRTLAEVMKDPDRYIRMPDPIRPAEAPLMREEAAALMQQSGERITALLSQLPADVSRSVSHALEVGLPQIIPLVRNAIAAMERDAPAAIADLTQRVQALEGMADKAVIHGSNNLMEVVDALRRSPDAMDSNVPVTTDFMRGARALATLDPEAYAVVRSGALPPSVGAEIANRVPLDRQAEVAGALRDAGVTSAAEARPLIDDLLPSQTPKDEMPLHGGAKITDPAGPEAKAQTDRLREEHADAIKEAEAPLKERDKVADQVETLKGEIVKLEEKLAGGGEGKPKDGGQFDPFQTLDGEPRKTDVPEPKEFAELAAKREELRAAELDLAARNEQLIPGYTSPLFRFVAERAEMQREVDLHTAIGDALRLADRVLPEDARVTVTTQRLVVDGFELDAMERAGDITLALHAVDPAARIGHEGVHALVSRGLLSPAEVDLLARAAADANVFKDEAKYREAYKDRENLDRLIAEEAAAHYVEARIKDQTPEVKSIADHVRALIERVKNALDGYGFKTAEDIRNAVLRGDVARRSARQEWMRRNDVTAVASDGDRMAAFAGEKALTADRAQWARAQLMEAAGKSRDDIWTETGWFRGVDRKWRFEIDDSQSAMTGRKSGSAPKILDHPELFAAYPRFKRIRASRVDGLLGMMIGGGYKPETGTLARLLGRDGTIIYSGAYDPAGQRAKVSHELQHATQNAEGFAEGANTRTAAEGLSPEMRDNLIADEVARRRQAAEIWNPEGKSYLSSTDAVRFEREYLKRLANAEAEAAADVNGLAYDRTAGEVEARTVEKRLDYTPEQRASRPPWLDYDVPEDQQIVRYANGTNVSEKAFSEEPPVSGHPTVRNLTMYAIRAFHGSPHDFERFDLSKIGTGEGAQAFGFGLYFAESEAVARVYRDQLGNYDNVVAWKGAQPPTPEQQRIIARMSGFDVARNSAPTLQSVQTEITRSINQIRMSEGMPGWDAAVAQKQIAKLRDELAAAKSLEGQIEVKPPGHLYEVRINAEPEQFLDWDKPLSQQSDGVRKALEAVGYFGEGRRPSEGYRKLASDYGGEYGGKEMASDKLRESGIIGIRYLDQGSRADGKGTYNYVVFDDTLIEITSKNGEPVTPEWRKRLVEALTAQDDAQPMFALRGEPAPESANLQALRARRRELSAPETTPAAEYLRPTGWDLEFARITAEADARRGMQRGKDAAPVLRTMTPEAVKALQKAEQDRVGALKKLDTEIEETAFQEGLAAGAKQPPKPLSEPLPVFHGTEAQFRKYDPALARADENSSRQAQHDVVWVTTDPNFASQYGAVKQLVLAPGRYFDWGDFADLAKLRPYVEAQPRPALLWRSLRNGNWGALENPAMIAELKRLGFDGTHMLEADGSGVQAHNIMIWSRDKLHYADEGDVMFALRDGDSPDHPGWHPQTFYHGTGQVFDRFAPPEVLATRVYPQQTQHFFSKDPGLASLYAGHGLDGSSPNVIPVKLRADVPVGDGTIVSTGTPGTVKSAITGDVMYALRDGSSPETIRAYHWTDATFDKFDATKTGEAGFHFGNMDQAITRSAVKAGWPWPLKGRLIPVEIAAGGILDFPRDVAHWNGRYMARDLLKRGFMDAETAGHIDGMPVAEGNVAMRDWLVSQGIDTIRYPNEFEGAGVSYMTLGTGNVRHARSGATLFALRPDPPKPPLHADVAMIDRMGMLKDLAMACRG